MYYYRVKPQLWRGRLTGDNYLDYRIERWSWFWPFWESNWQWPYFDTIEEAKAAIKHIQQKPVELQKGE